MKIVIDIPDADYKFIKDLQTLVIGGRGNCKTIQYNVIDAIKNGTPIGNLITMYECPNCGEIRSVPFRTCSMCGADMRGNV